MAQAKDITGNKYGRLTAVVKTGRDKFGIALWNCECECGGCINVRLQSLTTGATRSCGCLNDEVRKERMRGNQLNQKHSLSNHPLYQTWATMKQRCFNPKATKYYLYGGRGIAVDASWVDSFEQFLEDMGERPDGCTLDRKDNNGNYNKDNCKWSSYGDQNINRRPYKHNNTGLFNEI